MHHLFVYGTLMFDTVWARLVARPHPDMAASLHGHRRLALKGRAYPGLVRGAGRVDGVLRLALTTRELRALDRFEGDYYQRVPVQVEGGDGRRYAAHTYRLRPRYRRLLAAHDWDENRFRGWRQRRFLSAWAGFRRRG